MPAYKTMQDCKTPEFRVVENKQELIQQLEELNKLKEEIFITNPPSGIHFMGFGYIQNLAESLSDKFPNIYDVFALNISDNYALYDQVLKSKFKIVIVSKQNPESFAQLKSILEKVDKKVFSDHECF